jgi:nucleotide-binding universal stress UspA family protein
MTDPAEVREPARPVDRGTIVVGHDGSPGADRALGEALVLARALGASLLLVRAWSLATAPRPSTWEFGYTPAFDEYAEAVRLALVDDARPRVEACAEVPVEYRVVHESPSRCLVEVSRDALMLVVGARGTGGLAGMLLGSVSDQCVRHATCSVLVTKAHG